MQKTKLFWKSLGNLLTKVLIFSLTVSEYLPIKGSLKLKHAKIKEHHFVLKLYVEKILSEGTNPSSNKYQIVFVLENSDAGLLQVV